MIVKINRCTMAYLVYCVESGVDKFLGMSWTVFDSSNGFYFICILFPVSTQQKPPELGSIARFPLPTEGAIFLPTVFLFPDLGNVSPSVIDCFG